MEIFFILKSGKLIMVDNYDSIINGKLFFYKLANGLYCNISYLENSQAKKYLIDTNLYDHTILEVNKLLPEIINY